MLTTFNLETTLCFLDELSRHNQKVWFDEHRSDYEKARDMFYGFVDDLIDEFRESDHLEGLTAKECAARIYRDVRFSKDKSPYKTNLSAMIAPKGWKGEMMGYYVCVGPDAQSKVAGGLCDITAEQLNQFRQAIGAHAAEFKEIIQSKGFVETFGAVEGDRLKTAPKGYERDHPEIELLQLKQVTAVHHFSDQEVLTQGFTERVVVICRAMKPFLEYLKKTVQ